MKLKVDEELLGICKKIITRKLTITQWSEIESDDEFQTKNYCGGFDATENEFCFSYFDKNRIEYWFQISLNEVDDMLNGNIFEFEIKLAG